MNYIWELVLQADREAVSQAKLRFIQAVNPSPYQELSMEILNSQTVREACDESNTMEGCTEAPILIEANLLYRFANELSRIFDINVTLMSQTKKLFFDICMHYIARIDLLSGLSRSEYYLKFLEKDILENRFGSDLCKSYQSCAGWERDIICRSLLLLCRTGNYRPIFRKTVTAIYSRAMIYESTDHANELLLYLGRKETPEETARIQLLIGLLLPMQDQVHVFYEHHFGIIGVAETMILGEVVLF